MALPNYQQELQAMLARYRAGETSEAESRFIEQYYRMFDNAPGVSEEIPEAEIQAMLDRMGEKMEQRIAADPGEFNKKPSIVIPMYKRFAWVAAVLVLIAGLRWFLTERNQDKPTTSQVSVVNDIQPGKQRATLTLADGSKVVIEKDKNGLLTTQGATSIDNNNGNLVYNGKTTTGELQYNTLTTQKGERSGITFGDGTVMYVDAATQVKFPVNFTTKERTVELLEGQAYFEVAHDGRPFYVKHGNKTVLVLGTHFNVMAFGNEKEMKVTLVQGSVQVSNGKQSALIKPGWQAILSNAAEVVELNQDADVQQATAWRHGQFAFHKAGLAEILRELERWYDITVEVNGKLSEEPFVLEGSRSATLAGFLRGFDVNNIPYRIDAKNKKLIVHP